MNSCFVHLYTCNTHAMMEEQIPSIQKLARSNTNSEQYKQFGFNTIWLIPSGLDFRDAGFSLGHADARLGACSDGEAKSTNSKLGSIRSHVEDLMVDLYGVQSAFLWRTHQGKRRSHQSLAPEGLPLLVLDKFEFLALCTVPIHERHHPPRQSDRGGR